MNTPRAETGSESTSGSFDVDVRGPVAVLLSRFPTVTETFILREIREMERQGQPVRLVPLLRDDPPVVHEDARPWIERALFTSFLSPRIAVANLRAFLDAPLKYLSVLATLARGMARSPGFLLRSLALFPKAVYLAERLEEEGIRHVHAHFATHPATAAWSIAALSDLTYSVTVHAHDIFVDQTFLEEKLASARFVRVISDFNRQYLLSRLSGLDPERVEVIHVGVDLSRYGGVGGKPQPGQRESTSVADGARSGREGPDDEPLVVTVASLQPYKGISVLLDACRILRDAGVHVRCEVAGDGPLREELEDRATALGLSDRIRFHGAVPEDEIPTLLDRASVFVLPSVIQEDGQMEGIPVALMEAMAAGLPVVASDLSGIPELIEDGTSGLLLPPGRPEAIARAVRALLQRPGWAETIGRRARQRVRDAFPLEASVGRLLALMKDEVGSGARDVRDHLDHSRLLGSRASAVGVRRVHRGPDSWVAELILAGNHSPSSRPPSGHLVAGVPENAAASADQGHAWSWPRDVVLKVHRNRPGTSRPARERVRTEFDVLRRLDGPVTSLSRCRSGNGTGRFREGEAADVLGAPRPLLLDESAAALLMTRCEGTGLLELLVARRWTRDPDDERALADAFRRTGSWLRGFQDRTRAPGSAAPALDRVLLDSLNEVDRLRNDRLERSKARAVMDRLLELRGEAEPGRSAVLRHGDFWPGNVRVSGDGRVAVLDFEGAAEGHPLEDPAYFLVHLALYLSYPGLKGRRRNLERAFLEGYGETAEGITPAFDLCRRAAAARLLRRQRRVRSVREPGEWFRRRALLGILADSEP